MKTKYRCRERYKNEHSQKIIKILEEEGIKYDDIMGNGVDVHYKTTYTTTLFDLKTLRWD